MKKILSLMCMLSLTGTAVAEPTPSIRWAMDEDASLFELALVRLEMGLLYEWVPEALDRIPFELEKFSSPIISYDWDTNRIQFSAGAYEIPSVVKPSKEACQVLLDAVADVIQYDNTSLFSSDEFIDLHPIAEAFRHRGFSVSTTPENYSRNILNATRLSVTLVWYKDENGVRTLDGLGQCSKEWATGNISFDSGWN